MTRDEIFTEAKRVWTVASDAVAALHGSIDPEVFARCVEMIAECRGRIVTSGTGTSAVAARKIAHSLSCIERPAFFLSPADAVHGALGAVQPGDIAVLISKGGNTHELIALLPAFEKKGVPIIAVGENPDSTLGRHAEIFLRVKVDREADPFNMLATTSTTAVIAVFDAIAIVTMQITGYTREQFAVIHPGGAVGARLHSADKKHEET
ncbi:MAG: SIS domain-containing protein [Spirochaetaceae bacterium]|nr:MAG: SIS domain-containing protein [Spirochaetaceae bacterium]